MLMTLDHFYGGAGELFSFYRIPKALFLESRFQNLSTDAKTLYGILLDRMSLSVKNGWLDEQGRVFIVYTIEDVKRALCCADNKATKLIKATANPFLDEAYFQKRKFDKGMHRLTGKFKMIWKNQNGLCYHCGMPMDVTEEREIFYLAPKAKAGMEDVRNMRYVHCTCQRIYAENLLKK